MDNALQPGAVGDLANDAGRARPERLQTLARSFREAGVNVQLDLMADVSHERLKTLPQVQDFLVRHKGTK